MEKGTYIKVKIDNFKFWVIFDTLDGEDSFYGIVDNQIDGHYNIGDRILFKRTDAILVSQLKHFKQRLKDKIKQLEKQRTTNKLEIKIDPKL